MKLNSQYSDQEVETLGVEKSQAFGFSKDAEEMIFSMFTKNIYSNPIGSLVREITSNCFDSHKEAGVTDPVIIRLSRENNEYYLSFVDVGMGMSRERITKVYSKYFESTKRNDNNQIGGFGIGGKTPLAYGESFFLITTFNHIRYTYNIRKGKTSPVLDLLDTQKTTDHNGTTIKVPVRQSDISSFEREINRQLYYFENVIFEGFSSAVQNDYTIVEGKTFLYRGNNYNSAMHICLGRVAYPIDYNVFGDVYSNDWSVPVALKFNIGEINVTASREAIDYTPATKKLIQQRLKEAKAELLGMLDKQHEKINTLEEYYRMEDSSATLWLTPDRSVNVNSLLEGRRNIIAFKRLNCLRLPSQSELIHLFYDVSMYGKKGRRDHTWDKSLRTVGNENVYFVKEDEEMPRKKNAYMKSTFKHFYAIIRKDFSISETKEMIKKVTPDKNIQPSKTIFNQFRMLKDEVQALVEGITKTYASITVPAGFVVTQSRYNPNYEIPVTFDGKYGFDKMRIKLAEIAASKATIFYTDTDGEGQMKWAQNQYQELFKPTVNKHFVLFNADYNGLPVRFIMVSKSNMKFIEELPNVKPLSDFNKMLFRKRNEVIKYIEKKKFSERFEAQHSLFLNEPLFRKLDNGYVQILKKLFKVNDYYQAVPYYSISIDPEYSTLLQTLNIKMDSIQYKGSELLDKVEQKIAKNGKLKFVRISDTFDPTDANGNYSPEDVDNILQLLNAVYVK